jgi:hypothetical protein
MNDFYVNNLTLCIVLSTFLKLFTFLFAFYNLFYVGIFFNDL